MTESGKFACGEKTIGAHRDVLLGLRFGIFAPTYEHPYDKDEDDWGNAL
jgi:hypothetical protein